MTEATCAVCGTPRRYTDVLRVTDLGTRAVRHVCRPSIGDRAGFCFRKGVLSARIDSIQATKGTPND